ncbi:MAG: hypothetical protein EA402_11045 [Planctomycetota bacterium]|nr:MAG: hypothetical protein EA402_11045 [Planctomycetota bacterium]
MAESIHQDWLLWQLADSGFPTGAFAHSAGLESATQAGLIPDVEALRAWLMWSAEHVLASSLGYINAAHQQPQRLVEWDRHADTTVLTPSVRRASIATGNGLIGTAAAAFPSCKPLKQALRAANSSCHIAPVFGAVTATLGCSREAVQRLYAFQCLRDGVSAAVRLGRIGPLAAQGLLAELGPGVLAVLARHRSDTEAEVCGRSPVVELCCGQHDQLYSRLFQS